MNCPTLPGLSRDTLALYSAVVHTEIFWTNFGDKFVCMSRGRVSPGLFRHVPETLTAVPDVGLE
jgi:hypothetical protein